LTTFAAWKTPKAIIEDLRRKVYNPSQFEASLKSKIKEVFHDPIKWARLDAMESRRKQEEEEKTINKKTKTT